MLATFVRRSSVILALTAMPALSQTTISGTVRDDRNAPLAGATISVRGSHASVITNDAGRYRLVVPPELRVRGDSLTLLARRIGFEAGTRQVALSGSSAATSEASGLRRLRPFLNVGYSRPKLCKAVIDLLARTVGTNRGAQSSRYA